MELRKEIEPQFNIAEDRYSHILRLILDYADYCEKTGDEQSIEYKKLEAKLHLITGKEMSSFNLWEWWEEEGAENLAFDISLPDPGRINDLNKKELTEIVRRLTRFELPDEKENSFNATFYFRTTASGRYFDKLLKLNFKTYNQKLFLRQKDKSGNYFEYTSEEIVEKLWNNGDH
ncbi:hypothetical protein [Xanthocytophaga agilis]|uniref:Uncharacterized protein n=1 Tax=Xanthocytophaga agilis TaxID=3048010 RepID=A0AAE3UJ99_9BACT|nr:hypothetical protein [Xanthocytophaga agilis]MDJ1505622.1 hypothetical protein [Xanthocytophaga agilis]